MNFRNRLVVLAGALALAVTPAAALADGTEYTPAHPQHPAHPEHPAHPTPGPKAPLPDKAKAYGVYCRGFSKQHVAGTKGTPFSQCVTAMAKVANDESATPRKACRGFSKKHVAGEKGTPFSRCVVAAAQVRKDQGGSA
jgi:hypothetical protein